MTQATPNPISVEADARLHAAILFILADVPRLETPDQRARVADDIADMILRRGLLVTADPEYTTEEQ